MQITEKQFSQQVEDLLKIYGWRWVHFRPARTKDGWRTAMSGHQGFPDYVAVKGERLLFIELKGDKGQLTEEQKAWKWDLFKTEAEMYNWWPKNWDEIVAVLGTQDSAGNSRGR